MTLPLPTVPTTVYAANTEVKSADLNDYQTFMDAVKALAEGVYTRALLTNNSPLIAFTDRDGRARSYVGSEGYVMGNVHQLDYVFGPLETTGLVSGDQCTHYGAAGLITEQPSITLVRVVPGSTTAPATTSPTLEIFLPNAVVSNECYVYPNVDNAGTDNILGGLDNACVVLEASVAVSAIGASNVDVAVGLRAPNFNGSVDVSTRRHALLVRSTGDTNWRCSVSDGSAATSVDSGVAISTNAFFHVRIELHGVNTPVGVDAATGVARFFIDGVEVAEITTANVPHTGDLGPWLGAQGVSPGPTADFTMSCSRLKVAWNDSLDFEAPT